MRYLIAAVLASLLALPSFGEDAPKPVVVEITGEINEYLADNAIQGLKKAKEDKAPSILVRIDSTGGSVVSGLRLIAALRATDLPVVCEVDGLAASMAAVILESHACGKRVVKPYSIVMFHGVGFPIMGVVKESDAGNLHSASKTINRSIAALVAKRLGLTVEQYLAKISPNEWWLIGADAKEQGVADEVVELAPVPVG